MIVDAIFKKYDANENGFLQFNEVSVMLIDSFKKTNRWRKVDEEDVKTLLGISERNKKDKVDRK